MKLDVICPTYNNHMQLNNMINSMTRIGFFNHSDRRLIIVNNGKQPCDRDYASFISDGKIAVVNCEENKGWEGGLTEGRKMSSSEFIVFQNDDVHIPQNDPVFYEHMMGEFYDDAGEPVSRGMVGPITTTAAGVQSIFSHNTPVKVTEVRWLIFFCVMMRRKDLDEVGGVDEMLPGGDDFDLSIRMRKAGKKLYVNPRAFIVHHGFQTGARVHGAQDTDGGWNSQKMIERTNKALIQKHGFRTWYETVREQVC